jgi:hypothetical protein
MLQFIQESKVLVLAQLGSDHQDLDLVAGNISKIKPAFVCKNHLENCFAVFFQKPFA